MKPTGFRYESPAVWNEKPQIESTDHMNAWSRLVTSLGGFLKELSLLNHTMVYVKFSKFSLIMSLFYLSLSCPLVAKIPSRSIVGQ